MTGTAMALAASASSRRTVRLVMMVVAGLVANACGESLIPRPQAIRDTWTATSIPWLPPPTHTPFTGLTSP